MAITTTVHLNFRGQAREALDFYASVFGGDVVAITYRDAQNVQDPAEADQVMWGQVAAASGFHVMAYDVPSGTSFDRGDKSVFVSLRGDGTEDVTAFWDQLAVGGTIVAPLEPAQWSPLYGMVVDRFGITWVVDVAVQYGG